MRPKINGEYYDSAFLLSACFVWMISATSMLLVASVLLSEFGCTEKSLGYVSSLITFLSAMLAGISAGRKRKLSTLYTSLLTASVLTTALLTIGFMINGRLLVPSSVMSLISFTFTGCMVGVVFFSVPINRKKHRMKR